MHFNRNACILFCCALQYVARRLKLTKRQAAYLSCVYDEVGALAAEACTGQQAQLMAPARRGAAQHSTAQHSTAQLKHAAQVLLLVHQHNFPALCALAAPAVHVLAFVFE